MRGRAIVDGPLPFLFGANAERIKQRYWIRPLPVPKDVEKEYWLEAFPKTRQDAANYQKVHVIISQDDFLPKGLVIFDRNFDPQQESGPLDVHLRFARSELEHHAAADRDLDERILRAESPLRLEEGRGALRRTDRGQ